MRPALIEKAEVLARHAQRLGVQPSEFDLIATIGEAYELLDFIADGKLGRGSNHEELVDFIESAKLARDPWAVLDGWKLQGFKIARADQVLH